MTPAPQIWLRTAVLLAVGVALTGCAASVPVASVPVQPVTVRPDTLCQTKRPSWSMGDTSDTIAEQAAAAELWDRKCRRRKGKAG
jgi:hypothetical protein